MQTIISENEQYSLQTVGQILDMDYTDVLNLVTKGELSTFNVANKGAFVLGTALINYIKGDWVSYATITRELNLPKGRVLGTYKWFQEVVDRYPSVLLEGKVNRYLVNPNILKDSELLKHKKHPVTRKAKRNKPNVPKEPLILSPVAGHTTFNQNVQFKTLNRVTVTLTAS